MLKNLRFLVAAAVLTTPAASGAQAFPIAPPGSEGFQIIVSGAGPVIATYLGNSAVYSNNLWLMLDGSGNSADDGNFANDLFIFNNHASPVNSTANLGVFGSGTELRFRLEVTNTGENWFTGQGSRNADGLAHARSQTNWKPNETLVSFEDLYGTPEGVNGYNDLSFSFTNTRAVSVVPEPSSFALIGLGLGIVGFTARRRSVRR